MERDSSVDVTGESNSRSVNAYGSIMAPDESPEDMETAMPEEAQTIQCNCKGVCARKKGRGSCVCKASNHHCTEHCRCNFANCRNKSTESNVRRGTPRTQPAREIEADGEVQFQHDLQTSLSEIQVFVASLDASQKDQILTDLLCMGRGSLDFAKNLVGAAAPNPPPPPGPAAPEWCTCRRCRPMETDVENVCCKRVRCITHLNKFSNICLDRDILEVCIKARCDFRSDEFDFTMESFRKAGYRQYIMWTLGKLGRGNRRVVPSCVVWAIRDSFPSANGQYMGFRSS